MGDGTPSKESVPVGGRPARGFNSLQLQRWEDLTLCFPLLAAVPC